MLGLVPEGGVGAKWAHPGWSERHEFPTRKTAGFRIGGARPVGGARDGTGGAGSEWGGAGNAVGSGGNGGEVVNWGKEEVTLLQPEDKSREDFELVSRQTLYCASCLHEEPEALLPAWGRVASLGGTR